MQNKRIFWLLAIVVILSLALAACGPQATPEPTEAPTEVPTEEPTAEPVEEEAAEEEAAEEEAAEEEAVEEEVVAPALRIGLVTDVGEVDDKSFNQSAWEGVQAAAEATGGEAQYIETQDTTDYATNIAEFAENDFDIIVTVGFALGEATIEAAGEYPDINFIGVDQFQSEALPNLTGLVFNEDQAGYLAGVLAANLTESGKIAGVYGTDLVPPVVMFARGFEAGALATNPEIEVLTTYHPGGMDVAFTDPEWGGTTAAQAIDQGADVIFSAGGKTGNGGLAEVANRTTEDDQLFCIGVDTDQWETLPEAHSCLVSSAVKVIPVGVADIVAEIIAGNAPAGNYYGPVGLADFHDFADVVPEDVQAELAEIAAALTSGELETNVTLGGDEEEAAEEEAAEEETEEVVEEEAEEAAAPALRIGLVTDVGEVDDKSFNQSAWEGVQAAAEATGGEAQYIETQDTTDYATNIAEFAENDFDIIVTVGFALGEATIEAAGEYPDIYFIGVDQFQSEALPNLTGLVFNEDQAGYLAGVLAASLTESGKIAGVYGTDLVPPVVMFARGFEAGALATNPEIEVLTTYHPGGMDVAFTDPEWGGTTAAQAIDQGADVIFSAGGKTGNGGLAEVANRTTEDDQLFCIGVDTDQWETLPEAHSCLVSSAVKVIPVGVADIVAEIIADNAPAGNYYGPVGLADFHDFADVVPEDVQAELAEIAAALTSGELETNVTLGGDEEEAAEEETEEVVEEEAEEEAVEEEEAEEEAMTEGTLVVIAPGEPLMLGFAAALSGEGIEPLGVDELRGAELALADRPAVVVDGEEFVVALDAQDALCSGEGGQTVANRFASDESIAAVVGHMCSSSCTAAMGVYEEAGLTMVSPSCTAPNLTAEGLLSFNRVVSTDGVQGPVAADYIMNTIGATKIATIHDGSTYGEGLVTVTGAAFEELGGEVVSAQAINVGETDFRAVLEDIAAGDPELIYFAGFVAEGARLAEQRADVGLEDIPFMGADGIQAPEFVDLAGDAAEGVFASAPVPVSSDTYDAFLEVYEDVYDEAPIAPFHANTYDAVGVIMDAVEAVGTLDDDGNLVIDRAALAVAIRGTTDYQGLTGVLSCDENGECGGAVIDIYTVEDGEWVSQGIAE